MKVGDLVVFNWLGSEIIGVVVHPTVKSDIHGTGFSVFWADGDGFSHGESLSTNIEFCLEGDKNEKRRCSGACG